MTSASPLNARERMASSMPKEELAGMTARLDLDEEVGAVYGRKTTPESPLGGGLTKGGVISATAATAVAAEGGLARGGMAGVIGALGGGVGQAKRNDQLGSGGEDVWERARQSLDERRPSLGVDQGERRASFGDVGGK
jgi:hypothetical protein